MTFENVKRTKLNEVHIALGAKMVEFAGYDMPLKYSSVSDEHINVRLRAGMFDVSHMGEFIIKGSGAEDFIQYTCSNDASKLKPGQAQYSCLPNDIGGIVDDLLVYKINDSEYMLVVNASNIQKDWEWLSSHLPVEGVTMEDISDQMSLLAIQGPSALHILQDMSDIDLSEIPYYSFVNGKMCGISDVIISATGYTGAGGFELYVNNKDVESLWNNILDAGKSHGLKPAGLGARDTLRLEMGYCLYGNDIDDKTSPIEAGLSWITKFSKPFVNATSLLAQKKNGTKRKLIGFKMQDKGIPRSHYIICDQKGKPIGEVTSGGQSPSMEIGIGLGYVSTEFAKPGTHILIQIRKKQLPATIQKLPLLN